MATNNPNKVYPSSTNLDVSSNIRPTVPAKKSPTPRRSNKILRSSHAPSPRSSRTKTEASAAANKRSSDNSKDDNNTTTTQTATSSTNRSVVTSSPMLFMSSTDAKDTSIDVSSSLSSSLQRSPILMATTAQSTVAKTTPDGVVVDGHATVSSQSHHQQKRASAVGPNVHTGSAASNHVSLARLAALRHWSEVELRLRYSGKSNPDNSAPDHETGYTPLMLAARDNKLHVIERLTELGVHVNTQTPGNETAIHLAAASAKEDVINLLISKKADLTRKTGQKNQLPLHIVCSRNGNNAVNASQAIIRATPKNMKSETDKDGNIALLLAVTNGNQGACRELLRSHASEQLHYQHPHNGNTALHLAAEKRNSELVKYFLGKGASPSAFNKAGNTPIHIAASNGDLQMLEALCQHATNHDVFHDQSNSPLYFATCKGHTNLVEYLLDKYPDAALCRDKEGSTLLHVALDRGHLETAHAFMKRGMLFHVPNKDGEVSLHAASKSGFPDVVMSLLLKGATVDARTKTDFTALHLAAKYCRPKVVHVLLGFGIPVDIFGGELEETPLHFAAQAKDGAKVAEILILSGAEVNSTRTDGESAVHMSARWGNTKTFKLLLKEGGNGHALSKNGETPLHKAVQNCHLDIVKFLLESLTRSEFEPGSLVNEANLLGETSLHLASQIKPKQAHFIGEEVKIMEILLQYGGNPNLATTNSNESCLHYCARSGNIKLLEKMLRNINKTEYIPRIINCQSQNGYTPLLYACDEGHSECVRMLLDSGARVDIFDEDGKAALHLAAENGHKEIVAMLLEKKAFVNAKTKLGLTPLHLAAQKGFNDVVLLLVNCSPAERLIMVETTSLDKKTPLHKAAEDGKYQVCYALLNAGSDVEALDSAGETPLHLAAGHDHSQVVQLFLEYRSDLVTIANKSGWTCAHIAAYNGSVGVVTELLKSCFRKNIIAAKSTISHSTPLHIAAKKGHSEVVKVLLLHGADPFHEDANGLNTMHLAAKTGHAGLIEAINECRDAIMKTTRKTLYDVWSSYSSRTGLNVLHISAKTGMKEFAREMLLKLSAEEASKPPGIQIDSKTPIDWGFTPLHLAALSGHVNLVGMILNYPDVSVYTATVRQGIIPLHLAAAGGYVDVVELLLAKSILQIRTADNSGRCGLHYAAINSHVYMVSLLLGLGAEIDCTDDADMTPLHHAAKVGSLNMVKLLIDAGADPLSYTKDKKIPIQFAAANAHSDLVKYLLKYKHDSDKLVDDKTFIYNLMTLAKTVPSQKFAESIGTASEENPNLRLDIIHGNMNIIDEYIMASPAPIYTAARLSRAFTLSSSRLKEHGKSLNECARHCETTGVDLLKICSGEDGSNDILRAKDYSSKAFLDTLIQCEQKEVIASPEVQKYLTEIWEGGLDWSDWKFGLFFLVILTCVPIWIFLSLPLHFKFNKIPIIKFVVHLVSHLYLIVLFIVTVSVPGKPIYDKANLVPSWNEVLLLIWITGVLVNEITNRGTRTGVSRAKVAVLFFCANALFVHIIAFILPYNVDEESTARQDAIYIRNMLLSTAMIFAFALLLDFLSFHYLFGPWSIIIEGLLNDLFKFGVIVLLFMLAFAMWLSAVYQPVYRGTDKSYNVYGEETNLLSPPVHPLIAFPVLFYALFGLIAPQDLPPVTQSPYVAIYIVQFVYGMYHVITIIVLINLLIAMMSDTYQRIQTHSDREWKFGRAKLIRNMKKNKLSPSPINLFVLAIHYARRCCKNHCEACDIGTEWDLGQDHDDPDELPMKRRSEAPSSPSKEHVKLTEERYSGFNKQSGKRKHEMTTIENVVDWNIIRKKFVSLSAIKGRSLADESSLMTSSIPIQQDYSTAPDVVKKEKHGRFKLSEKKSKEKIVTAVTTDNNTIG